MNIKIYYVDAFTETLFKGNPAAVIFSNIKDPLLMQSIAAENNLSETAFIRLDNNKYYIRWFSPVSEIDLCGHATLASAFIYFSFIKPEAKEFKVFSQKNGMLNVYHYPDCLVLDFPKDQVQENIEHTEVLGKILGDVVPKKVLKGRDDLLVIVENELDVVDFNPDFNLIKQIPVRGMILSAPGTDTDFISRCFFPLTGVDEDPVTGSAHTTLTPYWSKTLGKKKLTAKQVSKRGGLLSCEDSGERVLIGGKAILYMTGSINLP